MEHNIDEHKIFEKYCFLLTKEKLPVVKDISLHELGYLAKNFENFMTSLPDASCSLSDVVPRLTELIVSFGLIKESQELEDRDYDYSDFLVEAQNAGFCLKYVLYLFIQYEKIAISSQRKFIVQALLLCATYNGEYFWSSKETYSLSKEFLKLLLVVTNHKTAGDLLCDETFHPTIFKSTLNWMRPSLMKDTWMKYPSSCYVYNSLLSWVKHPHLFHYLPDILPPPFMFSHYHSVHHQVLGIKCFDHILDNVPPSLIRADGIEDAIFDALKNKRYSKEAPIVEVLYPCLLKLPMMNSQLKNHLQWLSFDVILQHLLQDVDMESNTKLRHLFLSQAYLFIKSTPCFKHLQTALNVLLRNFVANSIAEEECRVVSLKIIKELVRSCWPRMDHHCFDIMFAILKAIYDVENPSYDANNELLKEILKLCEECLCLLKHACPTTFMNLVNEYLHEDDSMPGAELLKSIS